MLIETKQIKDIERATYNPRVELQPGDAEFESLKRSIQDYGMLIPIIWNKQTNRVVGGHQRLSVEEHLGRTEVDVSVVDLDETREKELNLILNKAQGAWDDVKLQELLNNLGDRAEETGFTLPEITALQSSTEDALDETFLEEELSAIEETFNVTLEFDNKDKEDVLGYIQQNGKEPLVEMMIELAESEEG